LRSRRDASSLALVGVKEPQTNADFGTVHPHDRETAQAAFQRTLREGVPYDPIVRIRRDDGTYMWIQSHGRLVYDESGRPTHLTGVIVDIDDATHDRMVNETLHRLAASFASELDHDKLVARIVDELVALIGAEGGRLETAPSRGDVPNPPSTLEVPVTSGTGEQYGVLHFWHGEPDRFTDEHMHLVASISNHAAVALENARLYRSEREHKEQLEIGRAHV